MTPEEREHFEREQVQHREREKGAGGPASEPEHAAEGSEQVCVHGICSAVSAPHQNQHA